MVWCLVKHKDNFTPTSFFSSWDTSVNVVPRPHYDSWQEKGFFPLPLHSDWLWSPPKLLSIGYHRLFPWEVKWPGHETDHSPPSSSKVKYVWVYTSRPLYVFLV